MHFNALTIPSGAPSDRPVSLQVLCCEDTWAALMASLATVSGRLPAEKVCSLMMEHFEGHLKVEMEKALGSGHCWGGALYFLSFLLWRI